MGFMLCTYKAFQVRKIDFLSLERDFREDFQKMLKHFENFVVLQIF